VIPSPPTATGDRHRRSPPAIGGQDGASCAVSCLLDAGMDGEDIDQAGAGKKPHHLVLRRGEQQVTAGAPGLRSDEH